MFEAILRFLGIWNFVVRNLKADDLGGLKADNYRYLSSTPMWNALLGRGVSRKILGAHADVALLLDTTVRILLEDLRSTEGSTRNPIDDVLTDLVSEVRDIEFHGPKNALQRKSLALKAIREFYPNIGKAEGNLLIEALLHLAKDEVAVE